MQGDPPLTPPPSSPIDSIFQIDPDLFDVRPVSPPIRMPEVTGGQIAATQPYDGTTDLEMYLNHIARNILQFDWTPAQAAAVVKNKLQGDAALWLQYLTQTNAVMDTWPLLRALMRTRFQLEFNEQTARKAVMNLNQRDDESVNRFFERITNAMDKKNHGYTAAQKLEPAYQTALMVDVYTFFSAGLKQDIVEKAMAGANPPRTAADLLRTARIIEIQAEKDKPAKAFAAETAPPKEDPKEPNKEENLLQEIAALKEGFKKLQGSYGNQRGRGYSRGRFRGGFSRGRGRSPGTFRQTSAVTCYNCQGTGHYRSECPTGRGGYPSRGQQQYRGRGQPDWQRNSSAPQRSNELSEQGQASGSWYENQCLK